MFRSALAALLVTLTLAAPAETLASTPGTYTQYLCRLPSGEIAPSGDLLLYTDGPTAAARNDCASGTGLHFELSGHTDYLDEAGFVYRAPQDAYVVGARIERSVTSLADSGVGYDFLAAADRCFQPCADQERGIVGSSGIRAQQPALTLTCRLAAGCSSVQPARIDVYRLEIDISDESPPTIQDVSGDLFEPSGPLSGMATGVFSVTDAGGGIYEASLVVDEAVQETRVIDTNAGKCLKPFTVKVPCKATTSGSFSLDTSTLCDGVHQVRVEVRDAAENTTPIPTEIQTANDRSCPVSTPQPPAGSGGGGAAADGGEPAATGSGVGAVVGSSVGGSGPDRGPADERPVGAAASRAKAKFVTVDESAGRARTVRQGSAATLRGRLVDAAGRPVAGAKVDVLAAVRRPGEKAQKLGTVTTDRTGAVTYRLRPGASSDVTFAYRPEGAAVDEATLGTTLYVRAGVRLARSRTKLRNGERMTLTARVLGRFVRPGATKVSFQVQIGRAWRTFATAAVDGRGVARIRHRFRFTTIPVTYRFRAVTTRTARFPYLPGSSNVAAVRVRP
jgi:hypothetical protein